MKSSAFRDFVGTSDVFKSSENSQFEDFQNITSDHKSRNARASSYDFLFILYSTKSLHGLVSTALYNIYSYVT